MISLRKNVSTNIDNITYCVTKGMKKAAFLFFLVGSEKRACAVRYSASSAMRSCMTSPKSAVKEKMKYSKTAGSASIGSASSEKGKPISP